MMQTVKPVKRRTKTGSFADKIVNKYALKESKKALKAAVSKKTVTGKKEEHL